MASSTTRWLAVFMLAVAAAACGDEAGAPVDGGGVDAAHPDSGGVSIVAPDETWTAVKVEGMRCGNGSAMPIAVNLSARSTRVVLFLQGGGACWDASTCYGLASASHLDDTLDAATVLSEAATLTSTLFVRDTTSNPFADASFVYVPYCTGDLYAGRNTMTYDWLGVSHVVAHVGAANLDLLLARLVATFPSPERITFAGISAGGYGVTLNWWRVRRAFPGVRVDVVNDSGTPIDFASDRWPAMKASWALELPPGCAGCAAGMSALLPHYDTTIGDGRFALFSYHDDATIALYTGVGSEFGARLDALRATASNARAEYTYVIAGTSHVVLATPAVATSDGVVAADWLRDFAKDAPSFTSVGP